VMLLAPRELLARLTDRLHLLTSRAQDVPERQRTMRGAIAWSYELLDERERRVFERFAVVAGGCTLDAAESVIGDEERRTGTERASAVPRSSVLDAIESLVEKSLLVPAEGADGAPRVRMLEVVREYALERLHDVGEAEAVAQRHAEYFLALAESGEPELVGPGGAEWLLRLETEHDNLRAALERLLARDADTCLRLAAALRNFWGILGYLAEGRQWLDAALKRSRAADAPVRPKALRCAGDMALKQGDLTAARAYFEKSASVAKEMGDSFQLGWATYGLGMLAYGLGEFKEARAHFEDGLAMCAEAGHDRLTAYLLNGLGEVARLKGERAAARSLYEEALGIWKRIGYRSASCSALLNLGAIALEEGNLVGAQAYFEDVLALANDPHIANREVISISLDGLGAVAARRGTWERAARLTGAAEAIREAIGYELERADRAFRDRYVAEARAELGEEAFASAVARGRAMTFDEAVRLAVEELGA
jgi:tetratricopeptide (TPR) repeat protein